jgi:hypothetical protein
MKKPNRKSLALTTETIRTLDTATLVDVAGGVDAPSVLKSVYGLSKCAQIACDQVGIKPHPM